MAHIVCPPCDGCKDTACLAVCPVDAFREDASRVYIDPDECIDCRLCVAECPVDAIFAEDEVPDIWSASIALNAGRAAVLPVAVGRG